MGVIIRQSLRTSLILYSGVAIGMLSRLFLLTRYLTPEEIGLVDSLIYITTIFAGLFNFGLVSSVPRCYDQFKSLGKGPDFIGFVIKGSAIGGFIAILILLGAKKNIIDIFSKNEAILSLYYHVLIPLVIFSIARAIFTNYALAKHQITIPTILNEFLIKVVSAFALILISIGFLDFSDYVHMYVVVYFISMLVLGWYVYKKQQFSFRCSPNALNKKEQKVIVSFASFVVLSSLSGYCFQYIDTIMLASMEGFSASGIYSIAFLLGVSIELPRRAITTISYPILVSCFNNNDIDGVKDIYKKSSINQGIIGGILWVLIWINIDQVFYFIPEGEVYEVGKYVVLVIGGAKFIDMLMGTNAELLRASSKYRIDLLLVSSLVLLSIGFNYFLIPIFSLNGAAVATLASIISYNIARFFIIWRMFKISPFDVKTLYLVIFVGIFIGFSFITSLYETVSLQGNILLVFGKSLFVVVGMTFLCYRMKLSDDFNRLIRRNIDKLNEILK